MTPWRAEAGGAAPAAVADVAPAAAGTRGAAVAARGAAAGRAVFPACRRDEAADADDAGAPPAGAGAVCSRSWGVGVAVLPPALVRRLACSSFFCVSLF